MKTVLVTGAAGFIGCETSINLLKQGYHVIGIDNINDYYDIDLKYARLERLEHKNFTFHKIDISDFQSLKSIFEQHKPHYVINLAAQAGVRYSLENPHAYAESNLVGFVNILECCRYLQELNCGFKHFVYASSSSVYGGNEKVPFEETDEVCDPRSLYAASKRSNELMAHTYANLFKIPCSGLRFFTVYGPWGRPDMSPMLFAKNILDGKPIQVFNHGDLWRDFTFIEDIVEGVVRLTFHPSKGDIPAEIYNIGNSQPIQLLDYIKTLEKVLGQEAILDLQDWPATEVYKTYASTEKLKKEVGYQPQTSLETGLRKFATWYKIYHKKNHQKVAS